MIAVEIGATQADAVLQLFSAAGLANQAVHTDLGGRQRVVTAHSPVVQGTFIPGP
jgi:release factor glutamine methyltransferase